MEKPLGHITGNVNPGLINPKRLLNWEGTIKKVSNHINHDYWGNTPPINKPWFINPGFAGIAARHLGASRQDLNGSVDLLIAPHQGIHHAIGRSLCGDPRKEW